MNGAGRAGALPPRDPYADRTRSPADTVDLVRPYFAAFGITRLARQTGLDSIGIPVWCAVRPNARTLAVNQGKGVDDEAARASAVMEAVEYALAERPDIPVTRATPGELRSRGVATLPTARYRPRGSVLPPDQALDWVSGTDLFTGAAVLVPLALVALDRTIAGGPDFARSTNGLASGNTLDEATLHAVCELVERDASTLFSHRAEDAVLDARVDPAALRDPVLDGLCRKVRAAGCDLHLFDMTSDLAIPCFFAAIADRRPKPSRHFDVSAGSGCHPVAARAAIRAVTEAAQTRVTSIAGARDDFDPSLYAAPLRPDLEILLRGGPVRTPSPPRGLPLGTPPGRAAAFAYRQLAANGVRGVVRVALGGERYGIAVARVLAPDLEDAPSNPHWRPGGRALRAMVGLA